MRTRKEWPVQILYIILLVMGLFPVPGASQNGMAFACAVTAAEGIYLVSKRRTGKGNSDLMIFFYVVLIVWEGVTDWIPAVNPILLPSPRAVFQVFIKQHRLMIRGYILLSGFLQPASARHFFWEFPLEY